MSVLVIYSSVYMLILCFLCGSAVKNPPTNQEMWVQSLGHKEPLEKEWQPIPVFLPGKFHRQRSLTGYVNGSTELDTTE